MVMSVNENRVLCELQANRETDCDEMATVRRGFRALHALQDYVDAQAGGPGKGFFQIVTDPQQARRVINQGRMAVVLEIEMSEPFGCAGWDQPTCDRAQVDRRLDEMHRLGVRSMLLLNKFDNPLTGVRFDSGPVGVVINAANRSSAGSFWSARTCTGPLADNTIFTGEPQSAAAVLAPVLGAPARLPGAAPVYPPAPHCNTRGLTPLGRHVVKRMMDLGMIVNPDHMSQAGVAETLSLLEARDYSGVISPHGWMDPGNWPRTVEARGDGVPRASDAATYAEDWQRFRPQQTPYLLGWGYGADLGGLSQQPAPASDGKSITYPFTSYDGRVTFDRQRTGDRTFDYRGEGVAHYGLYAGLVRRPAAGRRAAAGGRPVERRRGVPRDVGARGRHPRAALRLTERRVTSRTDWVECGSARAGRRCCAGRGSRGSVRVRGPGACGAPATSAPPTSPSWTAPGRSS